MGTATLGGFLEQLRKAMAAETLAALADGELLERFTTTHDEASFHALLRRHGPMVLRVCRRTLSQEQDVEDAFQATFLVLAREARSIRKRKSLASWLHGVAHRISLDVYKASVRRRKHETQAATGADSAAHIDEVGWQELRCLLDEELASLSERLRAPLVLCYLEGLTQDEAAARLGQTKSTFRRNLERGRELLCRRLTRRGVTLSAALLAPLLSEGTVSAALPVALVVTTTRAAAALAAGQAAAGASAQALVLVQRFAMGSFLGKAKVAGVLLLAVLVAGIGGAGSVGKRDTVTSPSATAQAAADAAKATPAGAANQGAAAAPVVVQKLLCKVPCLVLEALVQRELGLRPEQVRRIAQVVAEADRPHARELAALRERAKDHQLPAEQSLKELSDQRVQATIEAVRGKALREALPEILSEQQCGRLQQLELQLAGLGAFTDPDVEKLLALDEDQRGKIQVLAREPQGPGAPGAVAELDVFQIRKVPRVLEILREDQKQAWKNLCGRPMEFHGPADAMIAHSSFEMRRAFGKRLPARNGTHLPPRTPRPPGMDIDPPQPGRP
jgi:RNA polymerase sigma factor (sigma-70 family)